MPSTLVDYIKENIPDATSLQKWNGDNGAFILVFDKDGNRVFSLPVGSSETSQAAALAEYNVIVTDDGTAIATATNYSQEDSLEL